MGTSNGNAATTRKRGGKTQLVFFRFDKMSKALNPVDGGRRRRRRRHPLERALPGIMNKDAH